MLGCSANQETTFLSFPLMLFCTHKNTVDMRQISKKTKLGRLWISMFSLHTSVLYLWLLQWYKRKTSSFVWDAACFPYSFLIFNPVLGQIVYIVSTSMFCVLIWILTYPVWCPGAWWRRRWRPARPSEGRGTSSCGWGSQHRSRTGPPSLAAPWVRKTGDISDPFNDPGPAGADTKQRECLSFCPLIHIYTYPVSTYSTSLLSSESLFSDLLK